MAMTVSQVARWTGVSVRTLHYYDEVGLLRPSGRSEAGYRLYGPADLERLQQVLFFRELGFSLEEITRIVTEPGFDVGAALRMQRQLLAEKAVRLQALLTAVDAAIARSDKGGPMETQLEQRDVTDMFKDFHHEDYAAEVEKRWGQSEAYRESRRRTAGYTKGDFAAIRAEVDALFGRLAALQRAGTAPTAPAAMDAAEAHRQHIERWFYRCPRTLHRGLGELYVSDPRFTANLERLGSGLAEYARAAFCANAARDATDAPADSGGEL